MATVSFNRWLKDGSSALVRHQALTHANGLEANGDQPMDANKELPTPPLLGWFDYGTQATTKCWTWLAGARGRAEHTFLTPELLFPLIYGAALAANLSWVWIALGRPFHPAWIVAPLVMFLTADWTEQLFHLAQFRHYLSSDEGRSQNLWLLASGYVMVLKMWLTTGLYVSLGGLIVRMIVTLSDRRVVSTAAE